MYKDTFLSVILKEILLYNIIMLIKKGFILHKKLWEVELTAALSIAIIIMHMNLKDAPWLCNIEISSIMNVPAG